jgi:phosphoglycerate dehydrogenase-like enzyme
MAELTIFCDYRLSPEDAEFLRSELAPHQLIVSQRAGVSVLDKPAPDPAFAEADIAFGQPGVASILASPRLQWVQITSAGYTRYDTPEFRRAARERNLFLSNSSAVFAEPCAEHVLSFMLAQARQLPTGLRTRVVHSSPEWARLRSQSRCLRGQNAVILGFGNIAACLIAVLEPFSMKISALRRRPKGDEGVPTFTLEGLPGALADADHVINILPENAETRSFISAERLAMIKPGATFYNIGRGTTVDQSALAASLHSSHLAAAWLDVTDPEPLPDGHPLLSAPNCFITPHTAGGHGHEDVSLIRHFLENFARFVRHEALLDRVL